MIFQTRLPPELYRPVVEHLAGDRQTLFCVLLASKALQREGERVLYRAAIDLGCASKKSNNRFKHQQDANTKFLATITMPGREHLALHVRGFSLHGSVVSRRNALLRSLLGAGLRAMKNLKYLSFSSDRSFADILEGCTFQLEVFDWDCPGDEYRLRLFLPLQKSLIQFTSGRWQDSTEPILLPTLKILMGSQGVIERFLPGNQIKYLLWTTTSEEGPLDHLAPELNHLHTLSIGGYSTRILSLVIGHLDSLEVLELWGPSPKELTWLHRIQRLRRLILSSLGESFPPPVVDATHAMATEDLFAICKSLQYVDIQVAYYEDLAYERWYRSSVKPADELVDGWEMCRPWDTPNRWSV